MSNSGPVFDFMIVGQGLAGSLLFWELHCKGFSVAVIDEGKPITSSKIAAGMFNPINTKRFTVSSNAENIIPEALEIYRSIEKALNISIVHTQPIYNVFGNHKEANDYTGKLDHPFFKQYTQNNPKPEAHIQQPFGAFEVSLSGWIDLKLMLQSIRNFIQSNHLLVTERMDYAQLTNHNGYWQYNQVMAQNIVFCEGYTTTANPFFPELNIIPCKGDVIEFDAPELNLTRVVKKGVYIVQIAPGKFRCGSTYQWKNNDAAPSIKDQQELTQKIAELINVPFSITSHQSAIRPTSKTREILVTKHPEQPNMFAINGLGTKGVINGIKAVKKLLEHISQPKS